MGAPRILGIDPGLKTGWAYNLGDEIRSGVTDFNKGRKKDDHPGKLFADYYLSLQMLLKRFPQAKEIVLEEPFMPPERAWAIHMTSGFRAVVLMLASHRDMPVTLVAPGTLKKWATGNGRAKKPEMVARACEIAGRQIESHDEADAICLLAMALDREAVT